LEPAPYFPANAEGRERSRAFTPVPKRDVLLSQVDPKLLQAALALQYAA
jgi:hypothetical protein